MSQIILTLELPLSEGDKNILRSLAGDAQASPSPTEAPPAAEKPARARKAAPAAEKAEKAPEEPTETTPDGAEGPTEELLDEAIARATHLIRKEKRGAEVKEALTKVGVEKVTHLTDDETIRRFLDALPGD